MAIPKLPEGKVVQGATGCIKISDGGIIKEGASYILPDGRTGLVTKIQMVQEERTGDISFLVTGSDWEMEYPADG